MQSIDQLLMRLTTETRLRMADDGPCALRAAASPCALILILSHGGWDGLCCEKEKCEEVTPA